jgi:hypothetical protein
MATPGNAAAKASATNVRRGNFNADMSYLLLVKSGFGPAPVLLKK